MPAQCPARAKPYEAAVGNHRSTAFQDVVDLEDAGRRVQDGDPTAFDEVVRQTAPRLARLAMRMMGSEAEGEDALQQAYLYAFEALAGGRYRSAGPGSLQRWLYRIVSNAALEALRSRRREARKRVAAGVEERVGTGAQEARAALRELAEWLDALPPEQRVALVLKELEGLTSREISQLLGISEGAVEQRLVRARGALRSRVQ